MYGLQFYFNKEGQKCNIHIILNCISINIKLISDRKNPINNLNVKVGGIRWLPRQGLGIMAWDPVNKQGDGFRCKRAMNPL